MATTPAASMFTSDIMAIVLKHACWDVMQFDQRTTNLLWAISSDKHYFAKIISSKGFRGATYQIMTYLIRTNDFELMARIIHVTPKIRLERFQWTRFCFNTHSPTEICARQFAIQNKIIRQFLLKLPAPFSMFRPKTANMLEHVKNEIHDELRRMNAFSTDITLEAAWKKPKVVTY